jgi:glycosyltransferase involved in cell wall biosynthesis
MSPNSVNGSQDLTPGRDRVRDKRAAEDEMQRIVGSSTLKMKLLEHRLVARYGGLSQNTLVSVIMPTWNRARVIQRAIESVLTQSYRNFELIVSDDGSTDGTRDLIETKYGAVPSVSCNYNEHRGVSYARNSALERSRGEILAYLDSDNEWCANYLMVMVHSLNNSPDKACAYCGVRVINEDQQTRFTRLVAYDRLSLISRNYIDLNVFMHRRSLFCRHGGFGHNLEPLEDWDLILRYTREKSPLVVDCCLANYYISRQENQQTVVCDAASSYRKIRALHQA